MMKLSNREIAALHRTENKKAFFGDPLILAKMYRQLEVEVSLKADYIKRLETEHGKPTKGEARMRAEVERFADVMEERLKENDHKGGWLTCSSEYLLRRLREEVDELETALTEDSNDDLIAEAADIANFAMMIADKAIQQAKEAR